MIVFVDSNIPMYVAGRDPPLGEPSRRFQVCPIVLPVTIADTDRACTLVTACADIGVRDAVHAAVMLNHKVSHIATFDEGFDRVPGITRLNLA